MSNLSVSCKVSLSKKLRELLVKGDQISAVLTAQLVDGKGIGVLSLEGSGFNDVPEDISKIGETCIILVPSDIADETPTNASPSHATIFSTIPVPGESAPVIEKIAAVHAPDTKDIPHAVVPKQNIKTPSDFSELEDTACKQWVTNLERLIEAVNVAKGKRSDVDPDIAQTDTEKALLFEMKERDEAIDIPAWIVNDTAGSMQINDLNITLVMNAPYDLSNISARRIMMSGELKSLLRNGLVKFISPAQAAAYAMKAAGEEAAGPGLEVFDNAAQAEASMHSSVSSNPVIDDESSMEVSENDVLNLTEEEAMVETLRKDMPTIKTSSPTSTTENATRHAVRGQQRTPGEDSAIKPVRKLS